MAGKQNGDFAPWEEEHEKPLIRFENVTKRFGNFTAIDNLTLDIYEREFFSLLGPSGCGKTTLMRLLAGFETLSEGRILLDGKDLSGTPPHLRPVNMMFQSYALFPHLTVEKNIAFGLKQEKRPAGEIEARVNEMLKLVQLEDFRQRKPHQLSGGQRQRVALARSLAKSPRVLLLDEPLGALDRKLREATQFELMDIQERLGLTFLIVTHDQEEAMTVSSRVAVMDKGRIIQVDPPHDIYEKPKSRYVADFIGDVNAIRVELRQLKNGVARLAWGDAEKDMSVNTDIDANKGDVLWMTVRPEKISISKQKPKGAGNVAKGKVVDIAYNGAASTYHVELAGGQIIKVQEANRRHRANRKITWEENVWLSWSANAGVLLDR